MRTNALSLVVIALALLAIGAGFLGGAAGIHPPAVVTLRPAPVASTRAVLGGGASDAAVEDLFSDDDVVVERADVASAGWRPARLAFVVGLCGWSARIEAAFLHAGVPFAFDLDPHAPQALAFARLAHDAGARIFVHVNQPPSAAELATLRATFGAFEGVASRDSAQMPRALAGTGLAFFDERGDADPHAFARARVPLLSRDVTADDRTSESYVRFMLERAAERSQHEGTLTVLIRPLPSSLEAFEQFAQTRSVQIAEPTPT
ncbi:MAG: divergent polysaccharide deacetylase family protein [bacterium]|nr:divergent polysaccharide deacetylase family protein [bacterium]